MAESWKIASKESELSLTSYETSLSIANEEIKILEHNYQRLEDENRRLKEALYYADSIVYGVPHNTATPSNTVNISSITSTKRGNGNSGSGGGGGGNVMKKNINSKNSPKVSHQYVANENRRCLYSR
jgi:hypothetical protein